MPASALRALVWLVARSVVAYVCAALVPAAVAATSAARADDALELFESKIRPALVAHCYECHSAASGSSEGGLRLDDREALRAGGDSGPAVVPGRPGEGLLLRALRYADEIKMPPDGKLPADVIADFETWIAAGAPDPRDPRDPVPGGASKPAPAAKPWPEEFEERRRHWSFRPVADPPPPAVADTSWPRNPIDPFVLAPLERPGIPPAAPAEKTALLRRVTYALTGLPPTPPEVEAFAADASPDAYERVVDRLLASPRFGERFATHWLDLVRYADTHGSEGDPEIPAAWRYRDYVIRALDADLPYDRFVREQVAGDLLPEPRVDPATGTNESAVGPAQLRLVEHGFQPVDSLAEQVNTVDSQIDVVSKAVLGLTVSCARCHDHKFDPIGQRDYYALYGVLASCRPAQVPIDDPARLHASDDELAAAKARVKAALADAWLAAAADVEARLLRSNGSQNDGAAEAELAAAAARLDELDRRARDLAAGPAKSVPSPPPRPIAAWRFDDDLAAAGDADDVTGGDGAGAAGDVTRATARDVVGDLHAELVGGAVVRGGRLVLAGDGAFARSAPLGRPVREKTLEAWVALASLDQRGCGVVSLQANGGEVFDALVYGERTPRRWHAGSDLFRRSRELDAPAESAAGGLVHVAAAYAADGRIAFYRDGEPYGSAYVPADPRPVTFPAGVSRVLIGMRHADRGPLAGEVEEARLYDRALTADEVRRSFRGGPGLVPEADLAAALPPDLREERRRLRDTVAAFRTKRLAPEAGGDPWARAIEDAGKDDASPLRPWATLRDRAGEDLAAGWDDLARFWQEEAASRRRFNRERFTTLWDLTEPGSTDAWATDGRATDGRASDGWATAGSVPAPRPAGEFAIEPAGERVVAGVYPAGVFTHLLTQKHGGLLTSPGFTLPASVCVRLLGGRGGGMRVVVDNYPLGQNGTYPQQRPNGGPTGWVRLDTGYRAGSDAYLEFATYDDLTRPTKAAGPEPAPQDGRSYFGVAEVVTSDGDELPRDEAIAVVPLLAGPAPRSRGELAARYAAALRRVVAAWRDGPVSDAEAALLDFFVRRGLLPNAASELPGVAPALAEYRRIESAVPVPRRAPGVLEAAGRDAPLLVRGNHRTPGAAVPRGFLEALGGRLYETPGTGRLELAADLTSPDNPLVRRVIANRLWHWLFGRGLVPTPDNFGRLGEPPTHPELLDRLATDLARAEWSLKSAVRRIVTSQTYRTGSVASEEALERDAANVLFSRFRVRRLDAEAVRDGMLAAAGELDPTRFGPGAAGDFPATGRRSVYLAVRRTAPNPLLEVFDKPAPSGTRGRRDVTTLPAQSLTLLNSTPVAELSARWGRRLAGRGSAPADRVREVFVAALGREPTEDETARSLAYLGSGRGDGGDEAARQDDEAAWQDFVQAVLCMKETIYLR